MQQNVLFPFAHILRLALRELSRVVLPPHRGGKTTLLGFGARCEFVDIELFDANVPALLRLAAP